MARRNRKPTILRWSDLEINSNSDATPPGEDPEFFDIKILAEGDSWFSLNDFLPRGKLPTNQLDNLKFKTSAMIISCAYPGDTVKNVSKISKNQDLKSALKDGLGWDAFLLSGGGNDLLDSTSKILLEKKDRTSSVSSPDQYCDLQQFDELLNQIKQHYHKIARARDLGSNKELPIVTHTYDYATPRNSPARFINKPIMGPWICREFVKEKYNIPESDWIDLSTYLVNRLAEAILSLASPDSPDFIKNFHIVETRGTLEPSKTSDTRESGHWVNEFHPTGDGYKKLATKWYRVFNKLGI